MKSFLCTLVWGLISVSAMFAVDGAQPLTRELPITIIRPGSADVGGPRILIQLLMRDSDLEDGDAVVFNFPVSTEQIQTYVDEFYLNDRNLTLYFCNISDEFDPDNLHDNLMHGQNYFVHEYQFSSPYGISMGPGTVSVFLTRHDPA